jgi:membrane protein
MGRLRWLLLLGSTFASGIAAELAERRLTRSRDFERRGRHARWPWQMTWLGWKDVLLRTYTEIFDDRLLSVAAGVAFYALLALVPGLSVLVSLYGFVADPQHLSGQLKPLLDVLPEAGAQIVAEQVMRIAAKSTNALSFYLLISLSVAGWSANAAVKAMFDALNVIYDETEKRSFLRFNALSLVTTISAIAFLLMILFTVAILPAILSWTPYQTLLEQVLWLVRWPVFLVVAIAAIAMLYRIGPSRRAPRFPWVLPGATVAALAWVGASYLFGWYVSTLSDYTATYGSLAAIVVFMTWLWLSVTIVLIGAEINAELEHQTARDTTQGPPKPLGARGAVVADNIGPAVVES